VPGRRKFHLIHITFHDHDTPAVKGEEIIIFQFLFDLVEIDFILVLVPDDQAESLFIPLEDHVDALIRVTFVAVDNGIIERLSQGNFDLEEVVVSDAQEVFNIVGNQYAEFRKFEVADKFQGDLIFFFSHVHRLIISKIKRK